MTPINAAGLLPILTSQVVIRRLSPADLDRFHDYRRDPEVGRYQGWSLLTREAAHDFLVEMAEIQLFQPGHWSQLALADPSTDQLLGDLGILVAADTRTAEVGFTLHPAATGQGIATAAVRAIIAALFKSTPVNRLIAVTDQRNLPAIRLLERAGLQQISQAEAVFKGELCLELTWAIER